MSRTLQRIQKTGFVSCWPVEPNMGIAEAWFACFENGSASHYDSPLSTDECRAMVKTARLKQVQVVKLTGATIYQLVMSNASDTTA